MSFFDDLFDLVVDVVETAGSMVVDSVEFAGGVAADVIEGSFEVAGDIANGIGVVASDSLEFTGELIAGVIGIMVGTHSSDEQRQAAQQQYQRQLDDLRYRSNTAIEQYQQQQQHVYKQHTALAQQQYQQQQQALCGAALAQLKHERQLVRGYISQLKPRKMALKAQLDNMANSPQKKQLIAEIKAINHLLTPLYAQLTHINSQSDALRLSHC